MRKLTKRSAAIVAATVISVGGGTAAFAYASGWFQGGFTANAASSEIKDVTAVVTIPGTAANRLHPGKTITVGGQIRNPNDYKVQVTALTVESVTATKGNATNADCNVDTAKLSAALLAPVDIDGGGNFTPENGIGTITMGKQASTACAGHTLTLTLKFDGELVA